MSKYRGEIGGGRAPWWLLAGVVGWLVGCAEPDSASLARPGALSAVGTDPAQDDPEDLTAQQRRQLEIFQSMLLSPPTAEIEPATRRGAAEELIAMRLAPATAILRQALGSGRGPVVVAVIEAMEASPQPVAGLLQTVIATLQAASPQIVERLSSLLPRYGEPALQLAGSMALDPGASAASRLGPITALGSFRSRQSAGYLMTLLEREPPEPAEVVAGACRSLERLTGFPFGSDAKRWRTWWAEHKDEPLENWLRIMVQQLSARVADLEQRIQQLKRDNDSIAQRVVEAEREVLMGLSPVDQFARLQVLLSDPLTPIRQFAVDRVERLLRDSELAPIQVQDKLAQRLADAGEGRSLRLSAARLLNDLNYPRTGELVAAALASESDPTRAAGYLEILVKRPSPSALDVLTTWLNDAQAGRTAADAAWALVNSAALDETALAELRSNARHAASQHTTPAHVRLLAGLGEDVDRAGIESWLDSDDPAIRSAAAKGLSWAGVLAPLQQRAADEAIYPHCIHLIAQGDVNLTTLRELVRVAPPQPHQQMWMVATAGFFGKLPPGEMLQGDDILASFDHVDQTLRVAVLARAARLPDDALPADQRAALFLRLAELWLATGNPQSAHDLLVRIDEASAPLNLGPLQFRAAALAGHYDIAAGLNNDAAVWVDLLTELAQSDAVSAVKLRDEIQRRFEGALDEQTQAAFDAANQSLPDQTPVPGAGVPGVPGAPGVAGSDSLP
ncbi:MAG: hypothetical protein IIB53_06560 [Planctomycetes bacterium]|nr:hypothetical protein [Planctomycetota bacterium]